jgi:hypothetical protein
MVKRTQEIERSWLVQKVPWLDSLKRAHIVQGYLVISSDGEKYGFDAKVRHTMRR